MIEVMQPIQLGGSLLGTRRHICAFFHSHDDQYRILLPFIKEGFDRGERQSTSSIRAAVRITFAASSQWESTRWRRNAPAN
jgi:hypothetical protein